MTAVDEQVSALAALLVPRLAHFAAVARTEHVTRAATVLGVPQSTLSRSLARLEADLGVPLFVRSGRTLRLSRAGTLLAESVERALAELQEGLHAVKGEAGAQSGRVSFGFLHTLGGVAVPALLRAFRREHPGVRFELVQRAHEVLLELLRTGALDLCLTSPLPEEPGLATLAMHEQALHLVVPRDSPLARRRSLRLAEVADEQFVGLERGYGLRTTTDAWCRAAGFVPRLAFEGEEIDTVRGLVAAGLGVALLPADPCGEARGVVELEVVDPRPTRTLGLVWRRDEPATAPVRAFRELVLGEGPGVLAGQHGTNGRTTVTGA